MLKMLTLGWNTSIVSIDFGVPTTETLACLFDKLPLHIRVDLKKVVSIGYEISIGTEDTIPLARILPENSLLRIEITGFNVDSETVYYAQALCENPTLRELDLSDNSIGTMVVVALAKLFHKNKSLKEVIMGRCMVNGEGARHFAQTLCGNTSLRKLDWLVNPIGTEGAMALAKLTN